MELSGLGPVLPFPRQEPVMSIAPNQTRGGTADGARKRPKSKNEDKEEKVLGDELDDSFPASDPPASTQPVGKEPPAPKPRHSD
jgi:hypothetical protein